MALDDDIEVLAGAPLFSLFPRDALRLLAFAAEGRTLREGEVLFRRGDRSDGGYVVTAGAVALDGPASFVAERGALIGQTALFVPTARPATATAREPSSVLRVPPALMRRVLEEFPDAARGMLQAVQLEVSTLTGGLERVRRRLLAIDEPAQG